MSRSANFSGATAVLSPPTPVAPGTSQTFNVTGLQAATTYWFAIKTQDDAGNWSGVSNIVSKTTLQAPDVTRPAPVALSVSSLSDNSATLSWNAVGDDSLTGTATSYDIRYSTAAITSANWATATQATAEPAPLVAGSPQTYTVGGLTRQRQYYFAIKVTDDAGNGTNGTYPAGCPFTHAITNGNVTLKWTVGIYDNQESTEGATQDYNHDKDSTVFVYAAFESQKLITSGMYNPAIGTAYMVRVSGINIHLPDLDQFTLGHLGATPFAAVIAAVHPTTSKQLGPSVMKQLQRYADGDGVTYPEETHLLTAQVS